MTVHLAAWLFGALGVPFALVWLGQDYRSTSPRRRRVFWGGVLGWCVGILAAGAVMLAPPVPWDASGPVRTLLVHHALVTGTLVGAVLGWLAGRGGSGIP